MTRIMALFHLFLAAALLLPNLSKGAEDWFEEGLSFSMSKNYDEAIKAFSRAIEINPSHAEAYNNRGAAWYHKGNYDRAIKDYTKALRINPNYADVYSNRGAAWYHKGDYDQAIADYTKALEINPGYADGYNIRGAAWYHKGAYDRAIADYSKALEIDPDSADGYSNRGAAWYRQGEYRRAIADYTKALEIAPDYVEAYNQLAWTLAVCPNHRYRNGAKAVELAQKAVEFDPGANTLDTLAAAYAEAGKFVSAIETQERVIALKNKEGRTEKLAQYEERLKSYRAHKPWREKDIPSKGRIKSLPRQESIKVPIANIRTRPTTRSSIVAKLRAGNKVIIVHKEDEWYIVKLRGGRLGWAHQSLFSEKGGATESTRVTLRFPIGRVRDGPSLDAKIKFRIRKGETASVIETQGDWYLVELADGRTGWAHQDLFFKEH